LERRIEYEEAFPSLYNSYSITHHYSTDYLWLYCNGCREGVSKIEKLYRYKCSLCHPLPDIDECGYTYQQWLNVMKAMHQPGRYSESVNAEDDALLKDYLRTMSRK